MTHDPNRVWYFNVTITTPQGTRKLDGTMTEGRCKTRMDLANALRDALEIDRMPKPASLTINHLEANEL